MAEQAQKTEYGFAYPVDQIGNTISYEQLLNIQQGDTPDIVEAISKIANYDEPSSAVKPGFREHSLLLNTPIKKRLTRDESQAAASPASPAAVMHSPTNMMVMASSQGVLKRVSKTIKFHDRFRGKIQMMNKEGHIGVIKATGKPIEKVSVGDQLNR